MMKCLKSDALLPKRLSRSKGPAQVLIPKRGFTQLNISGGPMFDPDADSGFLKGIKAGLEKTGAQNVAVEEFDMHINDSDFAEILANRIDAMIKTRAKQ